VGQLLWLVAVSLAAFHDTYVRLGARLTDADVAGESSYNGDLNRVVADLTEAGLLTKSDAAMCAFLPGFTNRDGDPLPLIVRKADGGFGYDATDLAAIRHRVDSLDADRLVYVVDARQSLHVDQVFALARAAGWLPDSVSA
jgi:arginyl-tRNA synthetase